MDSELIKEAAFLIKELRDTNLALEEKLAAYKEAEKIAFDMLKNNIIAVEDLESVVNDLSNKSLKELEIIKLAKDYRNSVPLSPFKDISDNIQDSKLDPITRMLLEDL